MTDVNARLDRKEETLTVIMELLELGRLAEEVPVLAAEMISDMDENTKRGLLAVATQTIKTNLLALTKMIGELEVNPKILSVIALFSEDPYETERMHGIAMKALHTRAQLHQLCLCVDRLRFSPGALLNLREIDVRLHSLIKYMGGLDVERSMASHQMGVSVAHWLSVAHWWWTELSDAAVEPSNIAEETQTTDENLITAYITQHIIHDRNHQTIFRPSRDVARALGGTKRGLWLIEQLGDRLDLSEAEPTTQEIQDYLRSIK